MDPLIVDFNFSLDRALNSIFVSNDTVTSNTMQLMKSIPKIDACEVNNIGIKADVKKLWMKSIKHIVSKNIDINQL